MTSAIDIPVLETERLRLRAWRDADLDSFAQFCAHEATARFVGGVSDRAAAWRRMAGQAGHWQLRGYGSWVLEEKSGGGFIGYCGLWNPEGWPDREIMWGLLADRHGRGYATEAARCARHYAYRQLGWETAISCIDAIWRLFAWPSGSAPGSSALLRSAPIGSASIAIPAQRN